MKRGRIVIENLAPLDKIKWDAEVDLQTASIGYDVSPSVIVAVKSISVW